MKNKLTKAEIERRIEEINDARLDALEALASEVRKQYVVPACKKTGFKYVSGNGETFFSNKDFIIGSVDGAIETKHHALVPVFEILDIEVGYNDVLGYYIADVQPTERKS